jgi:hypothetical protein
MGSMVAVVNDELQIIWREGTSGPVKVLSVQLPGGTTNIHAKTQNNQATARIQIRHLANSSVVLPLLQPI